MHYMFTSKMIYNAIMLKYIMLLLGMTIHEK